MLVLFGVNMVEIVCNITNCKNNKDRICQLNKIEIFMKQIFQDGFITEEFPSCDSYE